MEKATYHEHLTRLREVFPDCEMISIPQAADGTAFTGVADQLSALAGGVRVDVLL